MTLRDLLESFRVTGRVLDLALENASALEFLGLTAARGDALGDEVVRVGRVLLY